MRSQYSIDPYYETPEWRELRESVLKRDARTCYYCGALAHQADHVIPRKKGGPDHPDNLVACCPTCNKTAGNHQFETLADKKKWVAEHRIEEEQRLFKPHPGRRPKKTEYPTKPKKKKSAFRKNLEQRVDPKPLVINYEQPPPPQLCTHMTMTGNERGMHKGGRRSVCCSRRAIPGTRYCKDHTP